MVVDFGEADVFKWEMFETGRGVFRRDFSGLNALHDVEQLVAVHDSTTRKQRFDWDDRVHGAAAVTVGVEGDVFESTGVDAGGDAVEHLE